MALAGVEVSKLFLLYLYHVETVSESQIDFYCNFNHHQAKPCAKVTDQDLILERPHQYHH